jgi:hypothetical protein
MVRVGDVAAWTPGMSKNKRTTNVKGVHPMRERETKLRKL